MSNTLANGISVRYIYSACVVISTPDVKILCDPWFTEGIYEGSWYHFPKLENPINKIGNCDVIYISHIHPDHYDPLILEEYFSKYGKKPIIIGDFKINYLLNKMKGDNITPEIISHKQIGNTLLDIVPNDTGSINDIDSALIVRYKDQCVANMNDCVYNPSHLDIIKKIAPNVDIGLVGYTGASAYPQTFYRDKDELKEQSEKRKQVYFDRYKKMIAHLKAKKIIPFAGKYILGGPLTPLNEFRGVADQVEVRAFDPSAVILADGGDAVIDTVSLKPSNERTEKYSKELYNARVDEIKNNKLTYEVYLNIPEHEIPFTRLIKTAYRNALRKSEAEGDHYYCFKLSDGWHVINTNPANEEYKLVDSVDNIVPRCEIHIDYRYLFGLITGVFHWNNAYVGSNYFTVRVPDQYSRGVQDFLNFFSVI